MNILRCTLYAVLLALIFGTGCGKKEPELRSDKVITPDEAANELFVEAVELVSEAQSKETTDIPAALKSYERALVKVLEITNKHKKSGLAVKLVSDEALLKGKSIAQLEERVKELKAEDKRRAAERSFVGPINIIRGVGATRQTIANARFNLKTGEMRGFRVELTDENGFRTLIIAQDPGSRAVWVHNHWIFYNVLLQSWQSPPDDEDRTVAANAAFCDELRNVALRITPDDLRKQWRTKGDNRTSEEKAAEKMGVDKTKKGQPKDVNPFGSKPDDDILGEIEIDK